jgi:hypothetical protein
MSVPRWRIDRKCELTRNSRWIVDGTASSRAVSFRYSATDQDVCKASLDGISLGGGGNVGMGREMFGLGGGIAIGGPLEIGLKGAAGAAAKNGMARKEREARSTVAGLVFKRVHQGTSCVRRHGQGGDSDNHVGGGGERERHSLLVGAKGIATRHGIDRTTHDSKVDQVQLMQGARRVVVMLVRGENGVEMNLSHLVQVLANVPNLVLHDVGLVAVDDDADDVGVVVVDGIGSPDLVVRRIIGHVGHENDLIAENVEKLRQRMDVKTLKDQFDPRFPHSDCGACSRRRDDGHCFFDASTTIRATHSDCAACSRRRRRDDGHCFFDASTTIRATDGVARSIARAGYPGRPTPRCFRPMAKPSKKMCRTTILSVCVIVRPSRWPPCLAKISKLSSKMIEITRSFLTLRKQNILWSQRRGAQHRVAILPRIMVVAKANHGWLGRLVLRRLGRCNA